ncbi:hypothetical protein V1478_004594 [Vespula squamosa]|uniref:Uncharacterized protein n=1 Tax=Vespula squamosa TaxID=30214 RepID=A0ABD2BGM2_VESSQ
MSRVQRTWITIKSLCVRSSLRGYCKTLSSDTNVSLAHRIMSINNGIPHTSNNPVCEDTFVSYDMSYQAELR